MGELQLFDILDIKNKFNLDIFIETGTGNGHSLRHVINTTNFENYYSIEIYKPIFDIVKEEFKNNKSVLLINDTSINGLKTILNNIPSDKNILFWLDAHFPGADFGPQQYSSEQNKLLRIPLEEELSFIKEIRQNSKDFFIIDDLRIYEDNNYEVGNWKDRQLYGGDGIDFIYDKFNNTHQITKLLNHQGYIILTPR
jgi:hypothetical protein